MFTIKHSFCFRRLIKHSFPSTGCSIFDFEKSPLQGWTSTNDAFKYQPILQGNNLSTNHHGNWIINSKRSMTSPCQAPGDHVDAKGTLTSPYFEIRTSNLTFLIGGKFDWLTVSVFSCNDHCAYVKWARNRNFSNNLYSFARASCGKCLGCVCPAWSAYEMCNCTGNPSEVF